MDNIIYGSGSRETFILTPVTISNLYVQSQLYVQRKFLWFKRIEFKQFPLGSSRRATVLVNGKRTRMYVLMSDRNERGSCLGVTKKLKAGDKLEIKIDYSGPKLPAGWETECQFSMKATTNNKADL